MQHTHLMFTLAALIFGTLSCHAASTERFVVPSELTKNPNSKRNAYTIFCATREKWIQTISAPRSTEGITSLDTVPSIILDCAEVSFALLSAELITLLNAWEEMHHLKGHKTRLHETFSRLTVQSTPEMARLSFSVLTRELEPTFAEFGILPVQESEIVAHTAHLT